MGTNRKAAPDTKNKVVALSHSKFLKFPLFLFNKRFVHATKKTKN
jgi:hypothetical protein